VAERIRCAAGAVALWLHDHGDALKSALGFLLLSAGLGGLAWIYQALCYVVNR
jgi:hypothetical protein